MDILTYGFVGSDWGLWARYVNFGFIGVYTFLIVAYVTYLAFPDYFRRAIIVYFIGSIVYEILMYSAFAISLATYAPAWLATGLVLTVLYMAVIPLFATLKYTRGDGISGSPQVKWIWIIMVGLLLWFFGQLILGASQILQMPGYDSFFSEIGLMITSTQVIGWYLIFVGFVFQARTSQSDTS
jgi:hypothetical protein